ncbi:hypothetical protein J437_LFUL002798 [Ladona fulva]|uniref:Uncharacterized protein n=1 Tax=Ladona fulva TaxID=123851 RepID=A0A8K0P051_LADFU|nr:hypothetical protein J437_LFUL002798 [Ladona fulva]
MRSPIHHQTLFPFPGDPRGVSMRLCSELCIGGSNAIRNSRIGKRGYVVKSIVILDRREQTSFVLRIVYYFVNKEIMGIDRWVSRENLILKMLIVNKARRNIYGHVKNMRLTAAQPEEQQVQAEGDQQPAESQKDPQIQARVGYDDHYDDHHHHHEPEGYWKKKLIWKPDWQKIWKPGKKLIWKPAWKKIWKPIWKEVWKPIWKEVWKVEWKKLWKPVLVKVWVPGEKSHGVDDHGWEYTSHGLWKKKLIWKPYWKKIWKPASKLVWVKEKKLAWKEAWKKIWVPAWKKIWVPAWKKIWKPVWISEWILIQKDHPPPSEEIHHHGWEDPHHGWDRKGGAGAADSSVAQSEQQQSVASPNEHLTPPLPLLPDARRRSWAFPGAAQEQTSQQQQEQVDLEQQQRFQRSLEQQQSTVVWPGPVASAAAAEPAQAEAQPQLQEAQ